MKNLARKFFIISLLYLSVTILWVLVFVDEPLVFFKHDLTIAALIFRSRISNSNYVSAIVILLAFSFLYHMKPFSNWRSRLRWFGQFGVTLLLVFLSVAIISAAFVTFETTFMAVMPFYADHMFVTLDRLLLLGHDAWSVAHAVIPKIDPYWIDYFYFWAWNMLFFLFPFVLFFLDKNIERVARYMVLYVFSSFVIGNVLAFAFMSVGPVYYDAYYHVEDFTKLLIAQQESGVSRSIVGGIQSYLGELFVNNDGSRPSDIAAFPSVHVSTIMFVTLYALERSKIIGMVMVLFTMVILFLSVYTGYHWLVDGLASILIMIAANFWLKKSRLPRLLSA